MPRLQRYLVVAVTLFSSAGLAHVAPSVDDNNRYIKVTPLGDRIRLAYTVFFGEVPGASVRRTIDANHDGQIDQAEAHDFGARLAAQVADAIDVEIDGHPQRVTWAVVDVGMGTPVVAAGSFSVDLVGYPCLPSVRGRHRVTLHDRFRLTRPGETEVKVEDSPGVTIERARVGPADDPSYDYRFAGPGGPLQDDGLELEFTAGERAAVTADAACTQATVDRGGNHETVIAIAIAGALGAGLAGWIFLRRRRA